MAIFNSYVKLPEGNLNISEPIQAPKKPCKNFSEMGRCQKNFRTKSQNKSSARLPIQGFSSDEDISRTWGFSLSWNWPSRTGDSTNKTGEALPEMDFTNILPSLVFTTPRAPGWDLLILGDFILAAYGILWVNERTLLTEPQETAIQGLQMAIILDNPKRTGIIARICFPLVGGLNGAWASS